MARKAGRELVGHSKNDEIGTPDNLFWRLDVRFRFDYDAAASHSNARTSMYSTKEGTWRRGRQYNKQDGLTHSWEGRRVFVNPPYSRPLFGQFIDKAIDERNEAQCIVMLVRYDPSTEAIRRLSLYAHIEPLPRIQYKGMQAAATFASAIAILRPDWTFKYDPAYLVRP